MHCRLLAVLVLRSWAAGEVCSNSTLLNHLCDPRSESQYAVGEFRHASIQVSST